MWNVYISISHGIIFDMQFCKISQVQNAYNISHWMIMLSTLQWRHNECDGVSNHQPRDCLLNRLFRRRSKKTSKLCVTCLCEGNSPVTGEFPAQRPVMRKMFPFDDVILNCGCYPQTSSAAPICWWNLRYVISKHMLMTENFITSCETVLT